MPPLLHKLAAAGALARVLPRLVGLGRRIPSPSRFAAHTASLLARPESFSPQDLARLAALRQHTRPLATLAHIGGDPELLTLAHRYPVKSPSAFVRDVRRAIPWQNPEHPTYELVRTGAAYPKPAPVFEDHWYTRFYPGYVMPGDLGATHGHVIRSPRQLARIRQFVTQDNVRIPAPAGYNPDDVAVFVREAVSGPRYYPPNKSDPVGRIVAGRNMFSASHEPGHEAAAVLKDYLRRASHPGRAAAYLKAQLPPEYHPVVDQALYAVRNKWYTPLHSETIADRIGRRALATMERQGHTGLPSREEYFRYRQFTGGTHQDHAVTQLLHDWALPEIQTYGYRVPHWNYTMRSVPYSADRSIHALNQNLQKWVNYHAARYGKADYLAAHYRRLYDDALAHWQKTHPWNDLIDEAAEHQYHVLRQNRYESLPDLRPFEPIFDKLYATYPQLAVY